jgi:divalent metal cation (Fe/Co/Zn/Cd) transporter
VLRSPDPTVKTVASEDSVAVVGVVVALAGTALHQITGQEVWDGVASLVIAALLGYVAFLLGRDTKSLLIGEAADPAVRLTAFDVLAGHEEVVGVKDLLTMQLGPSSVLVAGRVQFDPELTADDLAEVVDSLAAEMRRRVADLGQVFLSPAVLDDADRKRGEHLLALTTDEVVELEGEQGLRRVRTSTANRLARR